LEGLVREDPAFPAGPQALWFRGRHALLAAIYMTRLMVMTFWGSERFSSTSHDAHGEATPTTVMRSRRMNRHVDDHSADRARVLSTVGGLVVYPTQSAPAAVILRIILKDAGSGY
jgi:hypothetical protein